MLYNEILMYVGLNLGCLIEPQVLVNDVNIKKNVEIL